MKRMYFFGALAITHFLALHIGMSMSKRTISKSADEMQAELSFHHLQTYKELRYALSSNCESMIDAQLNYMIDEQTMLLAEYLQKGASDGFRDYIELRDQKLIEELRTYNVDWSKSWKITPCKNGEIEP